MHYFKLFGIFFRLGTLNELQYRANFFLELLNSLIALGTGIAGLELVLQHTPSLGDWSRAELLIVVGVFTFLTGISNVFIQPSMWRLMSGIQEGTFDYIVTKPEDAQFLSSVVDIQIWKAVDLILGAAVIIYGMVMLGGQLGVLDALAFTVTLMAGGIMIYSLWLIITTTAFWFVRVWSLLEVMQFVMQAGKWPVGIYPGWLRIALTFLVPVALAVTVPSEALTGKLTMSTMGIALAVAFGMLIISRLFFRFGLRHYSGASA